MRKRRAFAAALYAAGTTSDHSLGSSHLCERCLRHPGDQVRGGRAARGMRLLPRVSANSREALRRMTQAQASPCIVRVVVAVPNRRGSPMVRPPRRAAVATP
jgi:hypothetical protein